uniref:Uncharacterized protein n=1 Tax=Magnetococcus massalia (strain MO-1) TaxID=451514 RepID=A0A1S7LDV0_MAGMO|nr:Conserved protein of unknown function [Candidatus Magnetococcus massalia]
MKLAVNGSWNGATFANDGFADDAEAAIALARGAGREASHAYKQDFDLEMADDEAAANAAQARWKEELHGQTPDRRPAPGGWILFATGWATY